MPAHKREVIKIGKRIFWALNCVIAGLLIGYGLFMVTRSDVVKLGSVLGLVGAFHAVLSLWGYRKFVGKGIFHIK
jgi:multisubunit Na+/H+ antiporter MnhC subunit